MTKSHEAVRLWEERREEAGAAGGRHRCATIPSTWRQVSSLGHRSHGTTRTKVKSEALRGPVCGIKAVWAKEILLAKGALGGSLGSGDSS